MIHVFRVTRQGRPREPRTKVSGLLLGIPTEAQCRACPHAHALDSGRIRCTHPGKGCPRCASRIDPWTHSRPCPVQPTNPAQLAK